MPSATDSERSAQRRLARAIVMALALAFVLLLLLVLALAFRSAWWEEAGPPLPRGTELLSDCADRLVEGRLPAAAHAPPPGCRS